MMLLRVGRVTGLRSIPLRKTQSLQFCDDKKISDSKNVDKETEKKPKIEKKESASEKLNKLLASMSTDDNLTLTKKVEIPQAGGRSKSKKSVQKEVVEKEKKPKNLIEAAKGVANMLDAGADDTPQKRKTESELLSKLLNHIDSDALTSETTVKSGTDFNLNNIIVGMKIDRKVAVQGDSDKRSTLTRSQYVKKALSGKRYEVDEEGRPRKPPRKHLTQPVPNSGSVNLFGEEPLGIFKDPTNLKDSPDMLKTWSMLEERELKLAVTHPPRNYFEKMVLWTDQGKLWKFPIDNEQGLEREQEVDFSEHVFLDQHLEGWCPTRGPIRHFMELVCIGLSKNPYISAQEKQEHIYWFKDYFEQKKELLKDLIHEKGQQEELEQKQIKTKQINSITSHQKELLGVHQQMSSRASLHTKSSKSTDKTKFDTKSSLNSNENKGDREIRFIGHSATWLPSEQGKVKTDDIVESNKKIVFVGHSATWIPTSPSKQRSTSFSTSAMQSAQSIQTEKHCNENVSEIKKKNLKSVKDKVNTLQTSTNIQTTKQKNKEEESMKDGTKIMKQNINAKEAAKVVESNVVFDKDTNSLKIVTSGQSGHNQDSMTNKQNNILDAIKNFKIPEEVCDDIILSVPRYNLNKFITTIDPKSISDGIEMLVSEFEGKLEKNNSNIQKTATVNSVKNNERAPDSTSKNITYSSKEQEKKITTLNSNIPEKVVVYDKPNNKLNVVSTKENPQVLEEAKRQDKTLDVLQAQAIADYALKHWLESDSTNEILKEKPVTTNSKDPDLPVNMQKKIQEIREYSNKMTRFSSKLPETTLNDKLTISKTTTNNLETTEMKTKLKNTSSKPEMVLNPGNEEVAKVITDKELVFMGNMCYWIPRSAQRDSKIIPKESKPQSIVSVDQQNKLFDSSGVLIKTPVSKRKNEVVIGENVLSRIVVIDNRKNPVDLWKPEVSTKPSCPSIVQNTHSITNTVDKKSINKENQGKGNNFESFGVPVKYGKENIQLKETPVPLKNESKQQVTSKNPKSNLKSKPLFQAAQLEKHTEKYSNIENPTTTILKDGSIKKSFEPIKIVMNPVDLPKMSTTKTELKKEDSNKDKSIINKEKDELQKHGPLESMQNKVKENLKDNKIFGPQKVNTSADSVKLKSPMSKPLLKPQHPVTSTNIEQDNKSPVVEKVPEKPSKNLKPPVKSEKITSNNKENINFSIEANAVSTAPAANLEKKNSINTDIKTTVQIPNPEIIEKTKIDKEIKNVKEYKENLSNKPGIKNFDTVVKTQAAKIVTDQVSPKSKEHLRKETSFSNTWSKMEPKPQPTSSIGQPEIEVKNIFKENLKPKIKEEKPQKMPSVKNIEKSKHSVKQSTDANTSQRMTEAPVLKTPFKVKTPEFVKDNKPVKESGKITMKSEDQKDKILEKASPPSRNSKISTTGFVIIEDYPQKIEKEHELSKAEIKNSKTEMNKNPQAKIVESVANSSFVLIENTDAISKENVREDNKNQKEIMFDSKMNKDEKPSQISKDPIILGPPNAKLNETKRPEFVLVNSASQTYSLAEPLIEKKSDASQTKLNEEKVQHKSKIEPVSSVDVTKNLKNQKINPKVTLKTVEAEVKIDSSLSKDKPIKTSTKAVETERPESEHKMETSTGKPCTNINNASVKNLKINQPLIKTEQIQNQDQTVATNKISSTQLNEPKSTDSITKIKPISKENLMEIKSATTASSTSTAQNIIPLTASVRLEPSQSKKISNNPPTPLTSILSKNLEDIARKNGILKSQTQKGKSEPINNHIFSYPELTGTSKPQSEQPKLIVDKSLPNRFNIERQNAKQISPKIETIAIDEKPKVETSTVKLEPKLKAPTTSQSKPELLKALSPLERAYNKIDKKLEEIQREIELGDLKTATASKSSIADPKSLKEVRENFKATKEETTIAKSNESSSVKELLDVDKTLNPKMDDENIIRKTYIPFSYHVTSPKEEPKVSQNKPKLESKATKSESPFLNLNFLKNYMKEKPKTVDSTKAKSESILKQVTNMIKEELFTYQEVPKETGKKTLKLAEESLASQPTFDGNKPIKPGTIYNQVKNMLKEDLTNKTKSGPQFYIPNSVIPGAAAKIQSQVTPSILNENNKKKSEDVMNSKMELEKSEQLVNKSEPKDDLTFKMNQEPLRSERPAVAFAEPSVVPESVIVTETPPLPSKQTLNLADAKSAKKQMVTRVDKVQDVDQGTKAEINLDTSSDIKKFNKDVVENTNVGKSALTSESVVIKSSITNLEESNTTKFAPSLKPINATKPLEKEINKPKNDEEELYKILGISNDKSSRKEFRELPKPAESVMDRLRNYFEKSSPKLDQPKIIGASTTVTTHSDTNKVNKVEPLQAVKNKTEETNSDIQSQESKVLNNSYTTNIEAVKNEETITSGNKHKIASEPITEVYEAAKETQSDKFKNFIRTDSNNNSPYHMIKPLSLLEHLTNMDTEQVKIDHHMKLLSDSRSNSISNIELKSKSENSSGIQSPLLQAIEKDDVLMTPNPELVAKKTVSRKEKKSDSQTKDKPPTKSPETPQKSNSAKTVISENQVAAANEKTKDKKKEKVKEEEEEEENEDEIKKILDKEMKKSDKQLNHSVLSKDLNDKSPDTKIETKQPDSDETTPTKDTFRKDSVKPLDDNRTEPNHIIEGPGPSILDEETDIDPNKISNIKNKKSDEPPPIAHLSPLNQTIFETEISKPSSQNSKLTGSPNNIVSSDGLLHNLEQQQQAPESHIPLKIKPVEFSQQNQKFIKPSSKPLIKHLNNVAKVNKNISSSVLEDFKIEMDRYNSVEATPEDKNKITLKIKYLTKIEPSSESGGTHSESLTESSKRKKIDDLDKKPK